MVTCKTNKDGSAPGVLPVTLLSGFLGSGKTTLLQHILRSQHGFRIAVIVNDIGAINVDASLIKRTHRVTKTDEKIISLQNGCICCTLRGDLLEGLVALAKLQEFDYVIIESSGISEPEQVAETFDPRLAEKMSVLGNAPDVLGDDMVKVLGELQAAGGLQTFARLDTTVTVIDAFTMFHDFHTGDLLSCRRQDVTPEDERTVSDLMVDQIEFADVVVLNKVDTIDEDTRSRIMGLIQKLNHRAKIVQARYGVIDVKEIINTGLFDMERAQTGYGWLQDLHAMTVREVNGRKTITPKPETEEYNVRNFVYTRRRPFHPRRLFKLLHDKFILQLEHADEGEDEGADMVDADVGMMDGAESMDGDESSAGSNGTEQRDFEMLSNEEILDNKRRHPVFARLFRSKGEFFMATRPHRAGEWSQAGAMMALTGGRPWFCTLEQEEYETGDAEIDRLVRHDIASGGEWGDRRQEVVFIGEDLKTELLEEALDDCLLADGEFDEWLEVMRDGKLSEAEKTEKLESLFEDGFPDWPEEDHDHAHQEDGAGEDDNCDGIL